MGTWHHWVEGWLKLMGIPTPDPFPEDQFVVSTETGQQYVLENGIDHVFFSLRFPASGYRASALARHLLTLADPQQARPFLLRLGHDGVGSLIVGISLSLHEHVIQDLEAAFAQLWNISEILISQMDRASA